MSHELCYNLESGFVGCSFVNFLNAKSLIKFCLTLARHIEMLFTNCQVTF